MPAADRSRPGRAQASAPYARPQPPRLPSPAPVPPHVPGNDSHHDLDTDHSPLPNDARQLTRMTAMFWNARAVLNADIELRRAMDDDSEGTVRASATKTQKLNFALRDELNRLQPDLFDMLVEKDNHFMRNVRDKLNEGRSGAKAEDNGKVKNSIVHWRKWLPPLVGERKSSRGLNHPQCAELLAPITVNFQDPEARRQFLECNNPPMVAKHWPRFVYEGDSGNPNKPSEGLLRGELLIKAAVAILKSPTSALPSTSTRPNTPKRGRKGIASKYQLTKVTPAFVAYVAALVRFALSAEETFDDEGGTFNYVEFYSQVREFLEAPRFKHRAGVLMDWWNRELFPDSLDTEEDGEEPGGSRTGTMGLLDAEVEADEEMVAADDARDGTISHLHRS